MKKLLLILLALPMLGFGQELKVSVKKNNSDDIVPANYNSKNTFVENKDSIIVGEQILVEYIIDTKAENFKSPNFNFNGLRVLNGPNPSTQSSYTFVDGKSQSTNSTAYSFYIKAIKEGVYNINPATITVNGKTISSNSFTLNVIKQVEQTFEDNFYKANAYVEERNFDSAIVYFTKAIKLKPLFDAYLNRGTTYKLSGQYKDAIKDYNKAISLDDDRKYLAYYQRGMAYAELKSVDNTIEDLSTAIDLKPDEAIFYYSRGKIYENLKIYSNARIDYSKTLELDSTYKSKITFNLMGMELSEQSKKQENMQTIFICILIIAILVFFFRQFYIEHLKKNNSIT